MKAARINVTLPVYNEEKVLATSVGRVVDFLKSNCPHPWELVIASNGSKDRTQEIARELSQSYSNVYAVSFPDPGRGRTLKRIWSDSTADILSYMDVDLSTDLSAFPSLIQPLLVGSHDLAIGSRRLMGSSTTRSFKREFLSSGYHILVKAIFRTQFRDVQCGFKAITKRAAGQLLSLVEDIGWLMDLELLIIAERLGYRIAEVPVRWVEATDSRVKVWNSVFSSIGGLMRLRRRLSIVGR